MSEKTLNREQLLARRKEQTPHKSEKETERDKFFGRGR
jgi:hypothetical protein